MTKQTYSARIKAHARKMRNSATGGQAFHATPVRERSPRQASPYETRRERAAIQKRYEEDGGYWGETWNREGTQKILVWIPLK